MIARAFLIIALSLGAAAPLYAQEAPGRPPADTTAVGEAPADSTRPMTLEERVRAKLRALEKASRPVAPAADSSSADPASADSTGVEAGVETPAAVDPAAPPAATDSVASPPTTATRTPPAAADSAAADSVVADIIPADSIRVDIVRADSAAADIVVLDSIKADSIMADSAAVDSAAVGPPPPAAVDSTGTEPKPADEDPPIRFGVAPISGVIPASDSVLARLRALEGYVVTEYRSANARFDGEKGRLDLLGEPELERGTESMKADSLLSYDQHTAIVCGYGKPVLSGTGNDPVESDQVCYDVNRRVGVAMGARTSFQEQGTWYIHGSELYTSGNDRLYGSATSFTTCDLEEPHYHFSASEIKVVHKSVMVAKNVTLRFADVPVLWLPFMIQSLKPDRRSGLLRPTIGLQHVVRTSSGYRREIRDIGFYWAINEHLGLTTAMDWQSGGYIALRGRLQYRWLRQFLGGDVAFNRYWENDGRTRFTLAGNTNWQPGERTSLRASVNYASSNDFVRRYSVDPEELNRSIDSNIGLSHRFGWGNLNVTGSRRQHLSNDNVDLTLPSVTLSLNPITLFPAAGEAKWYNNATWQSNASFTASSRQVDITRPTERGRDQSTLQGRVDTRLSIGKLSWSSDFNFNESLLHDRPTWYDPTAPDSVAPDSLVFDRAVSQSMTWRTGLSFTQHLIENTHISPNISISGGMQMPAGLRDSLGIVGRVAEPTRLNAGASLQTNIFGFWPGVGPYSRIRHRIEPSLSYTYSPAPNVTELQRQVFGTRYDGLRETNQLSLTIRQTFEAKPHAREDASAAAAQDTVVGKFGEVPPRRLAQVQPITLLSVSSSALLYDFTRPKLGEYGFVTTDMTHTIRSDLVRGLQLSVGHDLFSYEDRSQPNSPRSFSPRLRTVNAQFSLSSESWPFRLFASRGEDDAPIQEEMPIDSLAAAQQDEDITRSVMPGSGTGQSLLGAGGNQRVGSWRSDFTFSMTRPPAGMLGETNMMMTAAVNFQPTQLWNVRWSTGYSFTTRQFSDHVLSLTREMHRWRAGFYFARTQMGTFAFRFNVQLLDNPDIKVDYDQRSLAPPSQFD